MNKPVFFLLTIMLLSVSSEAQLPNYMLSDRIEMNDSSAWGFTVTNFNYLRNTEYFNNIELGRTLFGYQLNPSLFIQPSRSIKMQAGVFVRNDFGGDNPYTEAMPTFSLKMQSANFSATFGTLEGALSHRIIEPMFDINSAIERRIENGVDLRFVYEDRKRLHDKMHKGFYNAWINWEKFIQRGSPYKEGFTAGINLIPSFGSFAVNVQPIAQTLMTHRGGQVDTDSSNMTMQINSAFGVKSVVAVNSINRIIPEVYFLDYRETSNSGYFPYKTGYAWYGGLSYQKTKNDWLFTVMANYFNGHQFISPRGTPIYQSISLDKPGLIERNRELVFLRFMYQKRITNFLDLVGRIEPVYDLRNKLLDYSYSLYLVCRINKAFGY